MKRSGSRWTAGPEAAGRSLAYWGLTVGAALLVISIAYAGAGDLAAAVASAGSGVIVVTLIHLAPLLAHSIGWRIVLGDRQCPRLSSFLWGRWVAESFNDLLPVLQVGGNVVRGRALARTGVAGPTAAASVVVDITLNLLTQAVFVLIGLGVLVVRVDSGTLRGQAIAGAGLMAAMAAGFYLLQRRGLAGLVARLSARLAHIPAWHAVASNATAFDAELCRLYRNRAALAGASMCHLLGWILGAAEVWAALLYLQHPVSVATAVLWESFGQAARTAAFAIPAALGVQEGGYVLLGSLLGVPPDVALAVSVVRRVRELLIGAPGLLAWQLRSNRGPTATAVPAQEGPH